MNIIVDMNLSPAWVPILTGAGFNALHWSTVGDPSAEDGVILDWACKNVRVIFTNDLDFGALLAHSNSPLPSVFQLRTENVSPKRSGTRVIALLKRHASHLRAGALVSVNEITERVRILPLK